jgi:uncharacterized membrane protein
VEHAALSPLLDWESFYVILGSSAAALTGLQFVVIVLTSEVNAQVGASTTRAFATPTIVHFCAVLLVSAILSAPWPVLSSAGYCLGASGVVGFAYSVMGIRHARQQNDYNLVFEDWLCHFVLPLVAYAALFVAALVLWNHPALSLFAIGGTTLLLLFVGIHNAWDSVIYVAYMRRREKEYEDQSKIS